MRTTLAIDDDVLADARLIAAAEGRFLGSVISDLARRGLAPVGITEVDGVPVFDVPAGTASFGADEVARALATE